MSEEWDEADSTSAPANSDAGALPRGFRSRGGGRGGFRSQRKSEDEEGGGFGASNGWGNGDTDGDRKSFGFGSQGRRGGFGGSRDDQSNEDDRFGRSRRGGGRAGFGRRDAEATNGGDEDSSGGFGGRRGGGRGGFRRRDDNDEESSGGFGSRRGGGRGGFGRRDDNDEESSGRFGGRRGGGRGGFSRRDDNDEESGGFGGGRGGFGRRDENDEDSGGRRGGRGGGRGGFSRRGGDEDTNGDGPAGGSGDRPPRTEVYIPPAPPEDEETLFATMAAGINFDKYDEILVEATGQDSPRHISSFEECGFSETTMRNIKLCNYTKPTPVQKHAIPIVMAGRDLMACAQTGSGKTAAFLLPVITKMLTDGVQGASSNEQQSPQVLIVSPTRELTLQIYGEARKFVHGTIFRPVVIYGGTSVGHQLQQLERGCNILVSTPGRLVDFLNRKKVLLEDLQVLILDEADRMLDMGFEPEIRKVVEQFGMPTKDKRQTLMFSATFPDEIQKLASEFLHNHIFLTVGVVGGTTSDIQQSVLEVDEYQKRQKLQEILSESGSDRILVFVETKRNADFLASMLSQENFPTTSIHGDRFQREREEALRDFRTGRSRVLVATSVAARGLDIPKVKHVINYDLPNNIEEYVHRIGRTGRIGNKGMATAFFQKDRDAHLARALVKVLAQAQQDVEPFLEQAAEEAVGSNYGPAGGKFASKDIRYGGGGGRRNFQGDSSGFGDDNTGGFGDGGGGFSNTPGGGFQTEATAEDDEW